jgi:hypothetical protein
MVDSERHTTDQNTVTHKVPNHSDSDSDSYYTAEAQTEEEDEMEKREIEGFYLHISEDGTPWWLPIELFLSTVSGLVGTKFLPLRHRCELLNDYKMAPNIAAHSSILSFFGGKGALQVVHFSGQKGDSRVAGTSCHARNGRLGGNGRERKRVSWCPATIDDG